MNRSPPTDVRRTLRAEAGFVCPMPDCRSPYLTYHHFDPPWRERQHHDPEGMIALCLQHHQEADVGTYTGSQLRRLKQAQRTVDRVEGRFNWKREKTLFICGGNYFLNCEVALRIGRVDVVWFTKSDEYFDLCNIDLSSADGQLTFSMRDNDWQVVPSVDDVEAPPSARKLSVRSKRHDVSLNIEFYEAAPSDLRTKIDSPFADGLVSMLGEGPALVCEMSGKVRWPKSVDFSPTQIVEAGKATVRRNIVIGSKVGVEL
jgi:hypothetical protein